MLACVSPFVGAAVDVNEGEEDADVVVDVDGDEDVERDAAAVLDVLDVDVAVAVLAEAVLELLAAAEAAVAAAIRANDMGGLVAVVGAAVGAGVVAVLVVVDATVAELGAAAEDVAGAVLVDVAVTVAACVGAAAGLDASAEANDGLVRLVHMAATPVTRQAITKRAPNVTLAPHTTHVHAPRHVTRAHSIWMAHPPCISGIRQLSHDVPRSHRQHEMCSMSHSIATCESPYPLQPVPDAPTCDTETLVYLCNRHITIMHVTTQHQLTKTCASHARHNHEHSTGRLTHDDRTWHEAAGTHQAKHQQQLNIVCWHGDAQQSTPTH